MKKILLYVGGFFCMALLAYGVFRETLAYVIHLPIELAEKHRREEVARQAEMRSGSRDNN